MIDVILVDDQEIVREGIKLILSLHEEINIIATASNGKELLSIIPHKLPNVVLMDIRMPFMDGIEATKYVKENYPAIKVIILTTFNDDEYIFEGLKNGADGYILKDSSSEEIFQAIKTACEGNVLLNPSVTVKVIRALNSRDNPNHNYKSSKPKESLLHLLTPRELEVAKLIGKGNSNKNIGKLLFVTEGTVKNYVSKILEKLELSSRTELVVYLNKLDQIN